MNLGNGIFKGIDNCLADGILQTSLDFTSQISGAVGDRVGLIHQVFPHIVIPGESQTAVCQAITQLLQHNIGDTKEILFRQAIKGDDFIHTVDKLRTQEFLQSIHGLFFDHIVIGSAEA